MRQTGKVFSVLLAAHALLGISSYLGIPFLETIGGYAVLLPFFSAFLFHKAGVPGVLEHAGHCGWGWCSPTPLGWALVAFLWLAAYALLAWLIARFSSRRADG